MSTGLSRMSTGTVVVADLGNSQGGMNAWVHPDTVAGTSGWSKDATTSGLYDQTKNRRYIARGSQSVDQDSGLELSYVAADANVSGAVGWGKPRLSSAAQLLTVYRPSSL